MYGTVEVFDPLSGSTPVQTLTNVSQATVALTDHPLIVEVEPGATIPAPVVTTQGSGPDTIDLAVSEDAYKGDAQFTVSVDGNAIGGGYAVHMPHGSGDDHVLLKGSWGAGAHAVQVAFINDAYGGSPTADRSFYLDGITFDGRAQPHTVAAFAGNGSGNFTVTGPMSIPVGTGPDTLTLHMSEDAYKGNAMFNVATGDVVTALYALHAAGRAEDFQFTGIGSGQHTVGVTFTNDA